MISYTAVSDTNCGDINQNGVHCVENQNHVNSEMAQARVKASLP